MDRNTPLYNPALSDRARAEWLVSQMTLEEKFACFGLRIRNERLDLAASTCGGEGAHGVQARAGQGEMFPPTPTTSFTQPIGMAASFDRELIRKAGDVTGKESRAFANAVGKGGHGRLAPTVDLCRDPRWGRNEEGYGTKELRIDVPLSKILALALKLLEVGLVAQPPGGAVVVVVQP